jgi:hypothetical protein
MQVSDTVGIYVKFSCMVGGGEKLDPIQKSYVQNDPNHTATSCDFEPSPNCL